MAQADPLITTLKKALKAQGLTYHAVAKGLGVSEASVKRYFSRKQFSLAQLERICQLLGMELSDLVRMMDAETRQLTELTEAQERELTSDIRLLLVAFLVVNGLTYQDLIRYYRLSETDTVRYLARLDRLRLIELFPQNRIKLLISPNFTWRRNGPIQQFFTAHMQQDFFRSPFDQRDEAFLFLSGMLSLRSIDSLVQQMENLALDFNELNQADRHKPLDKRFGYGMILAIRPWRPTVFRKLEKYTSDGDPETR